MVQSNQKRQERISRLEQPFSAPSKPLISLVKVFFLKSNISRF